jgi:hypothetical protein
MGIVRCVVEQMTKAVTVACSVSAHLRSLADDGEMPVADEEQVPAM